MPFSNISIELIFLTCIDPKSGEGTLLRSTCELPLPQKIQSTGLLINVPLIKIDPARVYEIFYCPAQYVKLNRQKGGGD